MTALIYTWSRPDATKRGEDVVCDACQALPENASIYAHDEARPADASDCEVHYVYRTDARGYEHRSLVRELACSHCGATVINQEEDD